MTADRHLLGQGRFVANRKQSDDAVMLVLRAPVARGKIVELDSGSAAAMPGVLSILTIADLDADGIAPLPSRSPATSTDGSPMAAPDRPILARDRVTYLGEPVAAVIATSHAAAEAALEAILLDIDAETPLLDPDAADWSDPIHPGIAENTAFRWERGNRDETRYAIAEAPHLATLRIAHPRLSIAPMETRSLRVTHDANGWTIWTQSQGVVSMRSGIADCLGVETSAVRVITEDVGGSFAAKIWVYPEHIIAAAAARRLGRAIFWESSRGESLMTDSAGRGRIDQGTLAYDRDGRFLAFRIDATGDLGAYPSEVGPYVFTEGALRPFSQGYHIPAQHYSVRGVYTNQVPTDAYRGAGKPESTATLERLIDMAARDLSLDPLEIRRRNLLTPAQLPYKTPMGEVIDSGDYPGLADALADAANWAGVAGRKAKAHGFRGAAVGFHLHATGGSAAERTEVRAMADGTVRVRNGAQETGQSHRETLAMIAAEALDLPPETIVVEQGDSAWLETGGGTGGSNLLSISGNNVAKTAAEMLDAAKARASEELEAAVADLSYGAGRFEVVGTDRTISLFDLAAMDDDETPACMAERDFDGTRSTFPTGAYAVEVEIDPETGAVRIDRFTGVTDAGRIINAPAALGQIEGGVMQAVGEVFAEALVTDAEGQLLTGSLMDYALPRADAMPAPLLSFRPTESPNSPLGVKGIGELPNIGAPGVLMNAVIDALAMFGVEHIDKPITSEKIWRAMTGRMQD